MTLEKTAVNSLGPSKEIDKDAEIRRSMDYLEVQPMDLSTVFGLILGFVALFVGMAMKGVTPDSLLNVAAILIIVVGTVAAVVIAFPMSELKTGAQALRRSIQGAEVGSGFGYHPYVFRMGGYRTAGRIIIT